MDAISKELNNSATGFPTGYEVGVLDEGSKCIGSVNTNLPVLSRVVLRHSLKHV